MKILKLIGTFLSPQLHLPNFLRVLSLGILFYCFLWTRPALSLTNVTKTKMFSQKFVGLPELNPFQKKNAVPIQKLWLKRTDSLSLTLDRTFWKKFKEQKYDTKTLLNDLARDAGLSPYLKLQQEDTLGAALTAALPPSARPLSTITSFKITFDGTPLCDYSLRSIQTQGGGQAILGEIPQNLGYLITKSDDTPTQADVERLTREGNFHSAKKISSCLLLQEDEQELIPVWEVLAINNEDSLSYKLRLSKTMIYKTDPYFFDVTGTVSAYEKNIIDSDLKEFSIPLTEPGTTLTNEYFTTKPFSGSRAEESDSIFAYDETNTHFAEASLFVYGNTIYDWYKEIGYVWSGVKPVELVSNAVFSGNVNNAMYLPAESSDSGHPQIKVGRGDGKLLRNLTMDIDVTAHEFGHHVVFSHLKSISGESLVLHEGLADYFVFAMTKDSCLGESICPDGSQICWIENKCLRTADNNLKYNDEIYKIAEPHEKGQIVSGTLWDLGLREGVGHGVATNIALEAVSQFGDASGFADFSVALFVADQNLYDGKYACDIYDVLSARNIKFHLDEINCDNTKALPPISGGSDGGTATLSSPATSKRSSSQGGCGVIGTQAHTDGKAASNLSWMFLFVLPLLMIRRKHQKNKNINSL